MVYTTIEVKAHKINKVNIFFICPLCSRYTTKHGKLLKHPKLYTHMHGSNGNFNNRVENRSAHCMSQSLKDNNISSLFFDIIIDDDTLKII